MQTKDVILQVSEETAEVMEEISDQLLDESKARFDEIADAIKDAAGKFELLQIEFKGATDSFDKLIAVNQSEIIEKVVDISQVIQEVSNSIQNLQAKQNELAQKQAEFDKDIKYLKLPFYKRWFTKE